MDLSKAAAALGRKGGKAGRGAAKARPLSSERAREMRAIRTAKEQRAKETLLELRGVLDSVERVSMVRDWELGKP